MVAQLLGDDGTNYMVFKNAEIFKKIIFLQKKKTVKENVKSCRIFKNTFDFQMESPKLIT